MREDLPFDPVDAAVVAALSLAPVAALYVGGVTVAEVLALDVTAVVSGLLPLFLALPLPIAYISTISRERFRVEALAAAVALPAATLGLRYAALSGGLLLGGLYVSYRTRSTFHGDNQFWTYFKAGSAAVLFLALAAGGAAAQAYSTDAAFRSTVQDGLVNQSVGIAVDQLGAVQQSAVEQRAETLVPLAGSIAANVSRSSIQGTEVMMFQAVEEDGSFSGAQQQLMRGVFDSAGATLPQEIERQTEQQLETRLNATGGGVSGVEDTVRRQVSGVVERMAAPSRGVLAAVFLAVFSFVMLVKIPFGIVAAIYAEIIAVVEGRIGRADA